jgi:hypothetical protein
MQAERYCLGAGICVAGVLALNLSRRDRNRADPSAKLRAGSLLGQVEVRMRTKTDGDGARYARFS